MKTYLTTKTSIHAIVAILIGLYSLYSFQVGNNIIGLGTSFIAFVNTLYALGGDS